MKIKLQYKKRMMFLLVLIFATVLSVGCTDAGSERADATTTLETTAEDPVKTDYKNYIELELPKILELEAVVSESYDSVSGDNYTDDETMYITIKDVTLPASKKLIAAAEGILPRTKTIRDIHEKYIAAVNKQDYAFTLILSALEEQDYATITKANELLTEARKYAREYVADMTELSDMYDQQ